MVLSLDHSDAAKEAAFSWTDSDGTPHAWGFNGNGRLGDGTTVNRTDPVQVDQTGVLAGKTITSIAGGGNFSMALTATGSIHAWGQGTKGELGNGAFLNSSVPVTVTTSGTALAGTTVSAITAGNLTSYARAENGPILAWGAAGNGRSAAHYQATDASAVNGHAPHPPPPRNGVGGSPLL